MNPTIILIADDDPSVAELLKADIESEGWQAYAVYNGDETIKFIHENNPDLVILDIGMPGVDGVEVCRHIAAVSMIPVVMLTGRRDLETKSKCLGMGAEEYITKPFRPQELMKIVKSVLLRRRVNDLRLKQPLFCGDLEVDFAAEKVKRGGVEIKLAPIEYRLLEALALNAGKSLTSRYLLNKVWGPRYSDERNPLHEYIDRLRSKIEANPDNPAFIITVPGIGYRFETKK